jgi:hypothetical protein
MKSKYDTGAHQLISLLLLIPSGIYSQVFPNGDSQIPQSINQTRLVIGIYHFSLETGK